MQVSEIKQQLHKAIDDITDEGFLQAMLTLISSKTEPTNNTVLSDKQIRLLQEREEKYNSGESEAINLDEFKTAMNKKYGL